ncbi:MAG: septal ring lytic transglycosylase RlpA family protein [Nitrospiria bacterium]
MQTIALFAVLCLLNACIAPIQKRVYGIGYQETGYTSWYGKDFHGRPTASGEIYNMFGISAAHKTLPLGTLLRVTVRETGRSIKVKINDRGPFVGRRILDLSYGAAKQLGIVEAGLAEVELEIIGRAPIIKPKALSKQKTLRDEHDAYVIQIGSFRIKENALRMKDIVAQFRQNTYVKILETDRSRLYKVQVGPYPSEENAVMEAERLRSEMADNETIFPIVLEADS